VIDIKNKQVNKKVKEDFVEKLIDSLISLELTYKDWEEIQREREVDR